MFPRGRLYSSVVERQSCKLKVLGSIPSGGFLLEAVSRHTVIYCCLVLSAFRLRVQTLWHVLAVFSQAAFPFSFQDTVSEWLRRWIRNPLGSARKGSNPLAVGFAPNRYLTMQEMSWASAWKRLDHSRGESSRCPGGAPTPGAWGHAGVRFPLSGA